jgi:hypothetical protein
MIVAGLDLQGGDGESCGSDDKVMVGAAAAAVVMQQSWTVLYP